MSFMGEISKIRSGLPVKIFTQVRTDYGLSDRRLAEVIRIPWSTLATRKKKGRFSFTESERLFRLRRLHILAMQVFENDEDMVRRWFDTPWPALGGEKPLDLMDTEIGSREVEDLLGRLEHGVYS